MAPCTKGIVSVPNIDVVHLQQTVKNDTEVLGKFMFFDWPIQGFHPTFDEKTNISINGYLQKSTVVTSTILLLMTTNHKKFAFLQRFPEKRHAANWVGESWCNVFVSFPQKCSCACGTFHTDNNVGLLTAVISLSGKEQIEPLL